MMPGPSPAAPPPAARAPPRATPRRRPRTPPRATPSTRTPSPTPPATRTSPLRGKRLPRAARATAPPRPCHHNFGAPSARTAAAAAVPGLTFSSRPGPLFWEAASFFRLAAPLASSGLSLHYVAQLNPALFFDRKVTSSRSLRGPRRT